MNNLYGSYEKYHQFNNGEQRIIKRCRATKEMEECNCNGDMDKCDKYPKYNFKEMTTAEMWLVAQETGKQYIAGDKTYNKKDGFMYLGNKMNSSNFNGNFDCFMNIRNWIVDQNVMTVEEAEKKFNIKIIV